MYVGSRVASTLSRSSSDTSKTAPSSVTRLCTLNERMPFAAIS